MKEELEKLKLISFVKTTGGKGLHVVVPIKRLYDWDEVKIFAQTFAQYIVQKNPRAYIATMSKAKRHGKVFIDYFRNQRGATAIANYSTRAKDMATIAVPLAWDELHPKIKSDHFTIKNILTRLNQLQEDPWADFFKLKQPLPFKK